MGLRRLTPARIDKASLRAWEEQQREVAAAPASTKQELRLRVLVMQKRRAERTSQETLHAKLAKRRQRAPTGKVSAELARLVAQVGTNLKKPKRVKKSSPRDSGT